MLLLFIIASGIFFAVRFIGMHYTAKKLHGDYAGGVAVLVFCFGLVLYPLTFSSLPPAEQTWRRAAPQPTVSTDKKVAEARETLVPVGIASLKQSATLMGEGPRKGLYRIDTSGIPGLKANNPPDDVKAGLVAGRWVTFEARLVGSPAAGSGGHGYGIGLFDDANNGIALDATNNVVYVFTYNKGTNSGELWAHRRNLQDGKMHIFKLKMALINGTNEIRFIGYIDNTKVVERATTSIAAMRFPGPVVFGELPREVYFRGDLKFFPHG